MGVDPDYVPVLESQEDEEVPATGKSGGNRSSVYSRGSSGAEDGRMGALAVFCDYCGGNGHPEAECPHRIHAHDSSSEEEEEEDSGNESDI